MRADDLDHKELLELDPEAGVIRFAGQRALLLDAVAMGLLRKYLVENFGVTAARWSAYERRPHHAHPLRGDPVDAHRRLRTGRRWRLVGDKPGGWHTCRLMLWPERWASGDGGTPGVAS